MDQISVSAAAGMRSRMEALDLLSNNLANANTGGYKLDREFYSLFQSGETSNEDVNSNPTLPDVQRLWTDFKQGDLQPTGAPLDLALNGKGFFTVSGNNGPLYTRNGAFRLSTTGVITSNEGFPLTGVDGKPIQTTSQNPITITDDGTVQQDGQDLAQIQIVDFSNPNVLSKVGSSYFRLADLKAQPAAVADTAVVQGKIESSNVAPAESAVRMVELMRQYEMLQKAVAISTDMSKKSLEEVARVGS